MYPTVKWDPYRAPELWAFARGDYEDRLVWAAYCSPRSQGAPYRLQVEVAHARAAKRCLDITIHDSECDTAGIATALLRHLLQKDDKR